MEKVLVEKGDLLAKQIVCGECTKGDTTTHSGRECTFFTCGAGKVSQHELRLSRIGYRLFIFLVKAKMMFPDKLDFELVIDQTSSESREFTGNFRRLEELVQGQIEKFDEFRERVQRKMMLDNKASSKAADNNKKGADPHADAKLEPSPSLGDNPPGKGAPDGGPVKKPLLGILVGSDKRNSPNKPKPGPEEEIEPFNGPTTQIDKPAGGEGAAADLDGMQKEVKQDADNSGDSAETLQYKLSMEDEPLSPYNQARLTRMNNLHIRSEQMSGVDSAGKPVSADLKELFDKFSVKPSVLTTQNVKRMGKKNRETNRNAGQMTLFRSSSTYMKSKTIVSNASSSTASIEPLKIHLSELALATFKKEDRVKLAKEYEDYCTNLAEFKKSKAVGRYADSIKFIRLSLSDSTLEDEFKMIQNTTYYVYPNVLEYLNPESEIELMKQLVQYPPLARKVEFLKEMNLMMGTLVAYQKLYAFKELNWIVWVTNLVKYLNIFMISLVNVLALFLINLANQDRAPQDSFFYSFMIINTIISGICSIFTPIEKIFLAKTYVTKYNSFLARIEDEYEKNQDRDKIIELQEQYMAILKRLIQVLKVLKTVLNIPFTKYGLALIHYDNLFQFAIFYLTLNSVLVKSLAGNHIALFMMLLKNSVLSALYSYLSVNIRASLLYTIFILAILFFAGAVYFIFFWGTVANELGLQCGDTLISCIWFAANLGLLGQFGYTSGVKDPFKHEWNHPWRPLLDNLTMEVTGFVTFTLLLVFMVSKLGARRLETSRLRSTIQQECLVCGVQKSYLESR